MSEGPDREEVSWNVTEQVKGCLSSWCQFRFFAAVFVSSFVKGVRVHVC